MKSGIYRYRIIVTIFLILGLSFLFYQPAAAKDSKKVIVIVIDKVSFQDFLSEKTPNLKKFVEDNGISLINIRSSNILLAKNPESSYLSLNMGMRMNAPDNSGDVIFKGKGLQVIGFNQIKKEMSNNENRSKVGLFGKTAAKHGLKIGLVNAGRANQKYQPAALMAMDNKGYIPIAASGLSEAMTTIERADITFVDFGDVTDSKELTLVNLNSFIDQLKVGPLYKNAMVILVSPNPSEKMIKNFNFSLTPFVIKTGNEESGLAYSKTTKRDGVVANLDLAPTILGHFQIRDKYSIGEPIQVKPVQNNTEKLLDNENIILSLEKIRFLIHGLYIIFAIVIFTIMFCSKFKATAEKNWVKLISLSLLAFPLVSVLLPLLTGGLLYKLNWWTYLIIILFTTAITSYFIQRLKSLDMLSKIGIISGLTAVLYIFESFTGFKNLLISPLGYNDVMIGGRFYGINNDVMSIFVAATIIAIFIWSEKVKPNTWTALLMSVVFLGLLTTCFGSIYGANVGGSITAISASVITVIFLAGKRLSVRRFILIIFVVFLVQVVLAFIDASFNPPLTHAGKAIQSISSEGWTGFLDILTSKTYQLFLMLVIPPWNILLFYQIFILLKNRNLMNRIESKYPLLHKGMLTLILVSIVGFAFNDTGVTVAGIILIYVMITMFYSLNNQSKS